jgi:hypothetical protein
MDFLFNGIDMYARSIAFSTVAGLLLIGFVLVLLTAPKAIWRSFVSTWPVQGILRGVRRLRAGREKPNPLG